MKYGSVCSGIEAATVAWHPLGWTPAFFSEIETAPRAVLAHHYPDVPLHGDFTTIEAGQYEPIDLLVGGTPCQDFSVAGLRAGLIGERGNLTLEFVRLAQRLRPQWLVWENVPGVLSIDGGRALGAFLGGLAEFGYGFAYSVRDAQFFGVPQRRRRVFVVGYLGDWRRAAAVLFERESLSGNPPPRREAGQGSPTGALDGTSPGGGWRFGADEAAAGQLIAGTLDGATGGADDNDARNGRLVAFGGNDTRGPIDVATAVNAQGGASDCIAEVDLAHPVTGRNGDAGMIAFDTTQITSPNNRSNPQPGDPCHGLSAKAHPPAIIRSGVRRLTPRECERLQGIPDDYTLIPYRGKLMADGPRYKMLGNSMAIPCMRWIGERIEMVRALDVKEAAA